jgi:predicted Zn-dependent protease
VYMQQFQFGKARAVIEAFLKEDPDNDRVAEFLNQIKDTEKADARRRELEMKLSTGGDSNDALELAEIYKRMGLQQLFDGLCNNIVNQGGLPPGIILRVAQMYADAKRFDMLASMLEKYVQRDPGNVKVWVDLAAVYANTQKNGEALQAIRKAIELGGNPTRDIIRNDARFNPLRALPEFNSLIPPAQANIDLPMNLPLPGM